MIKSLDTRPDDNKRTGNSLSFARISVAKNAEKNATQVSGRERVSLTFEGANH